MNNLPAWQQLTGLTAEAEPKMAPAERDAAIRKLLADVERRATLEVQRESPANERTVYWDPVEAACQDLGISRVKLSAYSRRLTGLRAQEIGDRIKAATLYPKLAAYVAEEFELFWKYEGAKICDTPVKTLYGDAPKQLRVRFIELLSRHRGKDRAPMFALRMGFPNITRLKKACVLALNKTLDSIITGLANDIVQKCVEQKQTEQHAIFIAQRNAAIDAAKLAATQAGAPKPQQPSTEKPAPVPVPVPAAKKEATPMPATAVQSDIPPAKINKRSDQAA